jgi:hypothetical protein
MIQRVKRRRNDSSPQEGTGLIEEPFRHLVSGCVSSVTLASHTHCERFYEHCTACHGYCPGYCARRPSLAAATAPSVTLGPTEQAAHPSRKQFITSSSIGSAWPISRSTRLKSRCCRSRPCRCRESGESAGDTGRAMLEESMLAKFERVRRIAVTKFNEFGPTILGSLLPDGV